MRSPSRRSSQTVLLAVYAATACFFASVSARGLLVPLIAHDLGADRTTVGLLFSTSTLSAAILSIPAGFLADRFGRREIVLLSALLAGATQLGIAMTSDVHLYLLFQFVGGIGGGAAQAALYAAVVDESPPGQLGRTMGWTTLALQVGFLAGPAIAGLLVPVLGLRTDLLATTVLTVLPLGLALLLPPNHEPHTSWDLMTPVRDVMASPGFWPVTLGLFAATLLWGTTQAYMPVFGKEQLRLPEAQIGYLLTVQAVINGASRVPGGWIVDRTPRKGVIVALGVFGYALAVLVLPHTTGFWVPALVLAFGVPFAATGFVAISVTFSGLGSAAGRGTAMGFYGAVLFAGLAVGPAVFGPLMDRGGYVVGFTTAAIVGIALAGVMLLTRAREFRSRGRVVALPPPAPGT